MYSNCDPGFTYGVLGGAGAGGLLGGLYAYATTGEITSALAKYRVVGMGVSRGFFAGGFGAAAGIGYEYIKN